MPLDPTLLDEVRRAEAAVAEDERALADARADYRVAVKRLHQAGAPLREIAAALGLSHQRVHQMVSKVGGVWAQPLALLSGALRRRRLTCAFCRTPARDVRNLIAGPRVHICDRCITLGREVADGRPRAVAGGTALAVLAPAKAQRCSFCRKLAKGDRRIVAGAGARICNDCLDYCAHIVEEEGAAG